MSDPVESTEAGTAPDASPDEPPRASDAQLHAEKYSDPRVRVTARGIAALVAIGVIAVLAAFASINARRTPLEKTTEFWGTETITALQLADRVHLVVANGDASPRDAASGEAMAGKGNATGETAAGVKRIELTALPGLGHLRNTFLDERHYDWNSLRKDSGMADVCTGGPWQGPGERNQTSVPNETPVLNEGQDKAQDEGQGRGSLDGGPECVELQFADPTYQRVGLTRIAIDLSSGFVGPAEGGRRVRMNERVRPALRHQLRLLMNFQQKRYDERAGGSTP